jgi:hypothetical protein
MLKKLVAGTGKTNGEHLLETKFPDATEKPGPSIRSEDFAEILTNRRSNFGRRFPA